MGRAQSAMMLALCGACAAHPPAAKPTTSPTACSSHLPGRAAASDAAPTLLVVSSGRRCDGTPTDLTAVLADETESLVRHLETAARDWRLVCLDHDPSAEAVSHEVEGAAGPLWMIFSGHGDYDASGRSELCLQGAPLAVDDLLARLPARVPTAVFMLNACRSADVDVRNATAGAATVISAAVDTIEGLFPNGEEPGPPGQSPKQQRTVLGLAMEQVLESAVDGNCDGWMTDRELYKALTASTVWQTYLGATFRLRSTAWADIPLIRAKTKAADCASCLEKVSAGAAGGALLRSLVRADLTLNRDAYDQLVAAPHLVARYPGTAPPQRATPWGHRLVTIVDPGWTDAMALASLTPLRALFSFGHRLPDASTPCQSGKWHAADATYEARAVDLVSGERHGSQVWYEIGGPPRSGGHKAGEHLRAVVCPPEFDIGQCFEVTK